MLFFVWMLLLLLSFIWGASFYFIEVGLAGASNLLLVIIIVPVFAVVLDAAILGQWVGANQLAGFALVVVGLAILDGRLWPAIKNWAKGQNS
jgi:drug/metabolite transporter (DMT)-like permease